MVRKRSRGGSVRDIVTVAADMHDLDGPEPWDVPIGTVTNTCISRRGAALLVQVEQHL